MRRRILKYDNICACTERPGNETTVDHRTTLYTKRARKQSKPVQPLSGLMRFRPGRSFTA